jgi:hypothetical protein
MHKKLLVGIIGSLFLFSCFIFPILTAENSLTFNSIKSYASDVSSSTNLLAYSISGVRNTLYFAFDFSNFPSDGTPQFAAFYVKSAVIVDACNVEAFYFSSADWVQTNSTTSDILIPTGASNFISQGDELYAYTSSSFIQAVTQACLEKGEFTVCLKAKSNVYGDSDVLFYPNATLDVTYSTTTSSISSTPIPTAEPTSNPTVYTSEPTSIPTSNSIQNVNQVGPITLDSTNILILIIVIGFVAILSVSIYKNRTAKKR